MNFADELRNIVKETIELQNTPIHRHQILESIREQCLQAAKEMKNSLEYSNFKGCSLETIKHIKNQLKNWGLQVKHVNDYDLRSGFSEKHILTISWVQ